MGCISCKWMGVDLSSPIILASLTLFSKPNVSEHINYFKKAKEYGIGAIILPSIHPGRKNETIGNPYVRCIPISSGLGKETDYMSFSVLGATDNIVSVDYGIALAEEAVKLNIPIFGSVANIGTKKSFLNTVAKLCDVKKIAGLELNFSCPNVLDGLLLDKELLISIKKITKALPISIKCPPQLDVNSLIQYKDLISSVTLSNAYYGLIPPPINANNVSPFDLNSQYWHPSGIYGPYEKLLTFYDIWKYKPIVQDNNIQLSSVGGFVNANDIIQAIMLGANSVQVSSMVFWKGLKSIDSCNKAIEMFLTKHGLSFSKMQGLKFELIKKSGNDFYKELPSRTMIVNNHKCLNCKECSCVEKGCYAFKKLQNGTVEIDKDICNGCGWCKFMCPNNAIEERNG